MGVSDLKYDLKCAVSRVPSLAIMQEVFRTEYARKNMNSYRVQLQTNKQKNDEITSEYHNSDNDQKLTTSPSYQSNNNFV